MYVSSIFYENRELPGEMSVKKCIIEKSKNHSKKTLNYFLWNHGKKSKSIYSRHNSTGLGIWTSICYFMIVKTV